MSLSSKQEISSLDNSSVNQAGRDVVINNNGLSAADVIAIVKSTVASELAIYSMKAETVAKDRLQKFSDDMVSELAEKVADKLYRFNEPSLQFAVRDAALGYVKSGSYIDEKNLIDLMIERVKADEHTTTQKLIDQAIHIVPTLSPESLAVLSLLAFRQLSFSGEKQGYINWVKAINSVIDAVSKVKSLDVEYLLQTGCATGFPGLRAHSKWEEECLRNLDLLLRHEPSEEAVQDFLAATGIQVVEGGKGFSINRSIPNPQNTLLFFASALVALPELKVGFNVVSIKAVNEMLHIKGLEHLVTPVRNLINSSVPFTAEEVVDFYSNINSNWRKVIELLNSRRVISFQLTPVGTYIGSRQLEILSGMRIPMDIFYKE